MHPGLVPVPLLATSLPDAITFAVSAVIVIAGAIGVVVARNPVHSALMLVMTLFGVAVLFVEQRADFLAAVQVIVYAGAIVVLFLFVIMLLGVDRREAVSADPLPWQRPLALVLSFCALGSVLALGFSGAWSTGAASVTGALPHRAGDTAALGKVVFTTYLLPFEVTAALLVIAVVAAVLLVRVPQLREQGGQAGAERGGAAGLEGDPEAVSDPGVDGDPQGLGERDREVVPS